MTPVFLLKARRSCVSNTMDIIDEATGGRKRRLSGLGVRKEGSTRFPAGDFTPVVAKIARVRIVGW